MRVCEAYSEVAEEAFQCNETMEARCEQEWGQLDLEEIVDDQIPDLERYTGRHRNESLSTRYHYKEKNLVAGRDTS